MGADIGLLIKLKNGEPGKNITISDLGGADDFYHLVMDGHANYIDLQLSDETKEKISSYKIVEDSSSPMGDGSSEEPIFLAPWKLKNIAEAIRTDLIRKINKGEFTVNSQNHLHVHNIMQIVGGIISICGYVSEYNQDEVALVCIWY
ncbi:hypothetical protein K6119_10720 [Paracrocinitomix mangrovi]|uniref:hypothetical protein n=1 Tax=Paracrocinitomix mangrovi TaxID=2862509 RepID=UPI001C8DFFCA|nr:hypothetical protein [Paracrocinitomix mangrovi]UKN00205.1 hypothetical protein K6119_10720 [Paracrocinitomix mangrovi]